MPAVPEVPFPDVPDDALEPDVPDEPTALEPDEPAVAAVPLVPAVADVPELPLVPDVPLFPVTTIFQLFQVPEPSVYVTKTVIFGRTAPVYDDIVPTILFAGFNVAVISTS